MAKLTLARIPFPREVIARQAGGRDNQEFE